MEKPNRPPYVRERSNQQAGRGSLRVRSAGEFQRACPERPGNRIDRRQPRRRPRKRSRDLSRQQTRAPAWGHDGSARWRSPCHPFDDDQGGIVRIGLSHPCFGFDLFREIAWQKDVALPVMRIDPLVNRAQGYGVVEDAIGGEEQSFARCRDDAALLDQGAALSFATDALRQTVTATMPGVQWPQNASSPPFGALPANQNGVSDVSPFTASVRKKSHNQEACNTPRIAFAQQRCQTKMCRSNDFRWAGVRSCRDERVGDRVLDFATKNTALVSRDIDDNHVKMGGALMDKPSIVIR